MFATRNHSHERCVSRLKTKISKLTSAHSLSLNENERRVMKVLMNRHYALGAYDIARQATDSTKRLQPNQVYRAVDKLIALGLAHRVKTVGGYIACHSVEECTAPMFLICTSCHQVAETENAGIGLAIKRSIKSTGFVLQHQNIELTGLCPDC